MENQGVFKSKIFGGFSKKDVLSYVDEMHQKAKNIEQELDNKIDALEKSNKELNIEILGYKEQILEIEQEVDSEKQKNSDLSFIIQDLKDEIEAQKRIVDTKEREISLHLESNRQLRMKNETLASKNKKFEELECQIADTMLEAKKAATVMLNEAQKKADEVTSQSTLAVADIKENIAGFRAEIAVLKSAFNAFSNAFTKQLESLESATENAEKSLDIKPKSQDAKEVEQQMPNAVFAVAKPVKTYLAEKAEREIAQAQDEAIDEAFLIDVEQESMQDTETSAEISQPEIAQESNLYENEQPEVVNEFVLEDDGESVFTFTKNDEPQNSKPFADFFREAAN